MGITVRRIRIDSQGYAYGTYFGNGVYFGVGEPLYYCPEIAELRGETSVNWVESAFQRAKNVGEARMVFKGRMERMAAHPKLRESHS